MLLFIVYLDRTDTKNIGKLKQSSDIGIIVFLSEMKTLRCFIKQKLYITVSASDLITQRQNYKSN